MTQGLLPAIAVAAEHQNRPPLAAECQYLLDCLAWVGNQMRIVSVAVDLVRE